MKFEEMINKVHCADCLEFMKQIPDKSIDLVLTDPPYGINVGRPVGGAKSRLAGPNHSARERESNLATVGIKGVSTPKIYTGFDDSRTPSKKIFEEMRRISKNQIIFGGNYFAEHLGNSSCWIVWDKDNGESFFADCELAWTSFKTAVRKFKWKWNGMLQEDMAHKEYRYHPTQKPLELMKWCLTNYSTEGQTIIDPFLGSGTTAVACQELHRSFIGIEISPEYCKIAEDRLKQKTLF